MRPIIPVRRQDAFDDPAYVFELKLDGFRALADTREGRMLSTHKSRMKGYSDGLHKDMQTRSKP
jgi:hypothetical protein